MNPNPPDLPRIASCLEKKRGGDGTVRHLRERDLEKATFSAYAEKYGVSSLRTVIPTPGWPSLGRSTTDHVAEASPGSEQPRIIAELKWIVANRTFKIWEAVWDLFKMTLQGRIDGITDTYLITGAPPRAWATDPCADIFESATHDVTDLCGRMFPNSGTKRPFWDYLLEGGYGRFPEWVPSPIITEALPPASLKDDPDGQQLRAVRALVPADHGRVPFLDGWPNGKRPPGARYRFARWPVSKGAGSATGAAHNS